MNKNFALFKIKNFWLHSEFRLWKSVSYNIKKCVENQEIQILISNVNSRLNKNFYKINLINLLDKIFYFIFLFLFLLEITFYSFSGLIVEYGINILYYVFASFVWIICIYFYIFKENLINKEKKI